MLGTQKGVDAMEGCYIAVPQISDRALSEVMAALDAYTALIEASTLSESTKRTYCSHADRLGRWLEGYYRPPQPASAGKG